MTYPDISISRKPFLVSLDHEWHIGPFLFPEWGEDVPDTWGCEYFIARRTPRTAWVRLQIHPYLSTRECPVCDGPTWAPRLACAVAASVMHDPVYLARKRMAEALGCTEADVRLFADKAFRSVMLNLGAPVFVAAFYYTGIRLGYPIYRFFNPEQKETK